MQLLNTKQFIKERFLPKLDALRLPYNVEVVHFATDCESIGQVSDCLVCACHAHKHWLAKVESALLSAAHRMVGLAEPACPASFINFFPWMR